MKRCTILLSSLGVAACTLLVSSSAFAQGDPAAPQPGAAQPAAPAPKAAGPGDAPPGVAPALPAPVDKPKGAAGEENEADKPAPNSVFAEGLGAGLLYSINYERRVIDDLGIRAGFGYWSVSSSSTAGSATASSSTSIITVPITVEYLGIRGRKGGLELGGGGTLAFVSGSSSGFGINSADSATKPLISAMVGYRLHPVGGAGFQFRVGAMVLAAEGLAFSAKDPTAWGAIPWIYLSFGAGF